MIRVGSGRLNILALCFMTGTSNNSSESKPTETANSNLNSRNTGASRRAWTRPPTAAIPARVAPTTVTQLL